MCESRQSRPRDVTISDCFKMVLLSSLHFGSGASKKDVLGLGCSRPDPFIVFQTASSGSTAPHKTKTKTKETACPRAGKNNPARFFPFLNILQHLTCTPDLSCFPHSSFFSPSVAHMLPYFCRVCTAPDVVPVCCYVVSSQPPVTG